MLQEIVPKALEKVIYGQMEEAKDFWFERLDCLASHVRHDFSSRRRSKGSNNKIKDVREKPWYGNEEHPFTLIRYMSINYVYLLSSKKT